METWEYLVWQVINIHNAGNSSVNVINGVPQRQWTETFYASLARAVSQGWDLVGVTSTGSGMERNDDPPITMIFKRIATPEGNPS